MADTINLFGSQVKRGYVIAGGAVVAAAIGYGWWKNRHQAPANTAAAATPSTPGTPAGGSYPPDGTTGDPSDPYSTDPSTGQTYGSEGQFAGGYGLPGGVGGYGYGGGYDGYGTSAYPPGTTGGVAQYTTNGQWAQATEDYLVNTVGASATVVAAALGKYITGQALTSDQVSVVEQAIAFSGSPPVNGVDGYPPNMRQAPAPAPPPSSGGGGSGGGSGGGGGQKPPPAPKAPATPSGVSASGAGPTGFGVRWNAVSGATQYRVRVTYQGQLAGQVTTGGTSTGISGLAPNRTYTVHVAAGNSAGWSAETNGPTIKTTR